MHYPTLLTTLTTLMVAVLGAPATTSSHTLATRDGPCDASSETCRPVLQANACFAAYIRTGTKEQVLQCVNDQDPVLAEEQVRVTMARTPVALTSANGDNQLCACYGCAETTVQDWTTTNLGCEASA